MTTDSSPRHGREGFTLIEVLVAMLILAVGLLGLEALGIGAARAVNRAQKQSAFAVLASDTLERTLSRIRQNDAPPDGPYVSLVGRPNRADTLRVEIRTTNIAAPGGAVPLRQVSVTVVPYPGSKLLTRADSLRVSGYVFN